MKKIKRILTVKDFNDYIGISTSNELISFISFETLPPIPVTRNYMGVYAIFFKNIKCGDITYGCQNFDYDEGTLVFVAPGQIYGIDSKNKLVQPSGYGLIFHPDFIKGTQLGKNIKNHEYFHYNTNEALHMCEEEKLLIISYLQKISSLILKEPFDHNSKILISSKIEILLTYCQRFYNRQFITRTHVNEDILTRFEILLKDYFSTNKNLHLGLPTVEYCAENLNLSPNYFGELIKREMGINALDYIHSKIIDEAKMRIFDFSKNFSEISDELGFKSQQHFTRLFKKKTGFTPKEYRNTN